MRKTAAAGIGYFVAAHGTFVTGNVYYLNHIRVRLVAAHCDFYTLGKYGAFLVDTATHGGRFAGNDFFRNIYSGFRETVVPCLTGDLTQYPVFEILYLCIEFSHCVLRYDIRNSLP